MECSQQPRCGDTQLSGTSDLHLHSQRRVAAAHIPLRRRSRTRRTDAAGRAHIGGAPRDRHLQYSVGRVATGVQRERHVKGALPLLDHTLEGVGGCGVGRRGVSGARGAAELEGPRMRVTQWPDRRHDTPGCAARLASLFRCPASIQFRCCFKLRS
jgi:hypothetical protein